MAYNQQNCHEASQAIQGVRWPVYPTTKFYKQRWRLLQSATGYFITECDGKYYEVRQAI